MSYTTKQIIELMEKAAQLGVSVEITDAEFSVKIDGKDDPAAMPPVMTAPLLQQAPATPAGKPAPAPAAGTVLRSPIVGTYYGSPAPDKEPFVTVGKQVKKGDVLYIVESMKLMNEVQSECDGKIKEILVDNGQAVEFGQPVMVLE